MPKVRRRCKVRRREYTLQDRKLLLDGVSLWTRFGAFHKGRADMEAMREAWQQLKSELMEEWIAEHPFTRPLGWLLFDATEPRERTEGEARLESIEAVRRQERTCDFRAGYFKSLNARQGAEETRYNEGEWETEKQYLCRIGKLTPFEAALL